MSVERTRAGFSWIIIEWKRSRETKSEWGQVTEWLFEKSSKAPLNSFSFSFFSFSLFVPYFLLALYLYPLLANKSCIARTSLRIFKLFKAYIFLCVAPISLFFVKKKNSTLIFYTTLNFITESVLISFAMINSYAYIFT